MELHEIENLTAAEIKAQRESLIAAAKASPPEQLAARYVQARLDAKLRDETLAEQGVTITNLNRSLADRLAEADSNGNQRDAAEALLAKCKDDLIAAREQAGAILQRESENAAILNERIRQLQQDVAQARALAASRRAALASVMEFAGQLNAKVVPLLAAE